MNQVVKGMWTEALREPGLKQCQQAEMIIDGEKTLYCALGVLGKVAQREGIAQWSRLAGSSDAYTTDCRKVEMWSGLTAAQMDDVIFWNDHSGMTLAEIASEIEGRF